MKNFFVIFLLFFLIFSTAIVKNSTKRIDDEIFVLRENIRDLKKNFENTRLEFDYLSSTEKLLQFQNLYFDNELIKFDIKEIKTITRKKNEIQIGQLSFNKNEE
tara:strand:+ start:82 stop:393 length:312 start_codon:yes stop_codon:yes gene_type:complete